MENGYDDSVDHDYVVGGIVNLNFSVRLVACVQLAMLLRSGNRKYVHWAVKVTGHALCWTNMMKDTINHTNPSVTSESENEVVIGEPARPELEIRRMRSRISVASPVTFE